MNIQTPIIDIEAEDAFTKAVHELMTITKMNLMIGQMVLGMHERSKASITQGSPNADPEALAVTLRVFEEEFAKEAPSLLSEVAELYKKAFTEDEINQVLSFYRSDIGQKFLSGSASMEQGMQQLVQSWGQAASKAAFERATQSVNGE
ncbi:DUF2059 domain-containing protein [Kordiimonas sp. SCSIO 12610]|uniref:DUF2059 domain-containing protein n=1 Tax=Kordiimonas sp. SCSIO 12610 TaxID=2829597 RepID=UPI00210DA840|nr:DUF2059 domain-containing protein [Kordiimonas sp. SCSIO 12610]UTW54519.1 DUF2059 domain-containing protein [Kordiimonas sp. SCSIO 12610]